MPFRKLLVIATLLFPVFHSQAQMWNGADTLYGNEWIDFSKTYYKITVGEDALYRVPYQALLNAGFPVAATPASQFRLYANGSQVPIFTSTDAPMQAGDFFEFYGEKNRGALDQHLFDNPASEQVNPGHSMFTDSTVYYLTWSDGGVALRYQPAANDLSNLPPKTEWCWYTNRQNFANAHVKRRVSNLTLYSWFDGNGYARGAGVNTQISVAAPRWYAGGPSAQLSVRYACGLGDHQQRITVNDSLWASDNFSDWGIVQHMGNVVIPPAGGPLAVRVFSALGGSDWNAVAEASLRYPRQFHFENTPAFVFELDASDSSRYLEIQAFNTSGGAPLLYDLELGLRMQTTVENGLVKIHLPPALLYRRLLLVNPVSGLRTVNALRPVQFRDFRPDEADYIIISAKALFSDPKVNGANHVAAYADYRRSAAGGSHTVSVVDVNELYDQFAYGQRNHPIAIRNFLHYAEKVWPDPRFAFLIGKGMEYTAIRNPGSLTTFTDSLHYVPIFGSPGADALFALHGNRLQEPIMAVGRLAVTDPYEIRDYLDKIQAHEQSGQTAGATIADKAWMKRVIHNSGGFFPENLAIRDYVENMRNILSNNRFGADVYTYYKTSNDPVQLSSYEQMLDLINSGVSIWAIFGHSSPTAVDFDIGAPNVYNNPGRYPLMLIMGCFSGQCSNVQKGIGEQFVLAPNRGAIAYIASVNYGVIDALHQYARKFYELQGGEDYGKSVGEILQHTLRDYQSTTYPALIALLQQNLLQGDPAVRVQAQPGPDFVIDPQSVQFNPNPIGLQEDRFSLKFDLLNIGENTGGQLAVQIDQRLPDQTLLRRALDTLPAPPFRRTLEYTLPVTGSAPGFNRFLIGADVHEQIAELPAAAELNNTLIDASGAPGVDVYFYADDVQPLAPPPYGIASRSPVMLRASTLNTNAAPQRYRLEFDSTYTFDSPFKKTAEFIQRGGLLEWPVPATLQDSAVYYWRVARDTLVGGKLLWRTRSFVYLPGSAPGWNQSAYGQYRDGSFVNMQAADTTGQLEFIGNAAYVTLTVAYRDMQRYPGFQNGYYEGFLGDYGWNVNGVNDGVVVVVLDPNTGRFVKNPGGGPYNHNNQTRFFYWFSTRDSLKRVQLMDFLQTQIPDGYYCGLLAFSRPWDTIGYAPRRWARDSISYGKNIFQLLEAAGAPNVRKLTQYPSAPRPYGLLWRQGYPDVPARDTIVNHPDSTATLRLEFLGKWTLGFFETPPIGPAKAWKSLHWRRETFDDASDEAGLSLWALRDGLPDTLLLSLDTMALDTSLDFLSAQQFPRLKLRYDARDTLTRSVSQPLRMRVLYEGLPEGALHPAAYFDFHADTLQQGDPLRAALAFVNTNAAAFDSLLVQFRVEQAANVADERRQRLRPLGEGDSLRLSYTLPTALLNGPYRFVVEVNPAGDQPEQFHFNNVLVRDFFVARDGRNPLLDVTFDGTHILDGDLVSPRPLVTLTLRDDNRFLPLTDTTAFSLSLSWPDGATRPLAFSDPAVQFFPADPGDLPAKNQARVEWSPHFYQDGTYVLRVNGRDASGNEAGALDYAVRFQVINKSSLSNLLNYPNPFSTSTCFVYTLTGAEPPAHFKIQIMTVSGRVVREITETEFGPLRPGTHKSDYCWDGKDEYGDPLANGVYLYRVVAKKADGSDFELFGNQSVDGFFKNGWGKMVLMR